MPVLRSPGFTGTKDGRFTLCSLRFDPAFQWEV
jgi:hypothetical protein